jgi:aminoglycoside 6'-N-acetyltransferase I
MGSLPSALLPGWPGLSAVGKSIIGTQAFSPDGPGFAKRQNEAVVRMSYVATVSIRQARPSDARELAALCTLLWPEGSAEKHLREVVEKIASGKSGMLPVALLVAEEEDGRIAGLIEVGLRSHADGCDSAQPAGYIEGWFVRETDRGRGTGRQLMQAAEDWARKQGSNEIASDALIENLSSQEAHGALGFEIVDRCVHFRKSLHQGTGSKL